MILQYRDMAGDRTRVDAFRRAIEATVRPGDVAVEIGTGLGTYAIFACRAGARKVYAIEREDVILTARQIAEANGCADRIEFLREDALTVVLPERADVLITEDFSPSLVDPEPDRLIRHARKYLLKRDARIIPASLTLFATPVSCPATYRRIDQWAETGQEAHGIDFSATREMVMNWLHRARFKTSELIGAPKAAHTVDLDQMTPLPFDGRLRYRARKSGMVHGIGLWFEARLAPRVKLSNAPDQPATLWGQALLPLAEPLRARKGASITVDLAARFAQDTGRVWWQWEVGTGGAQCDGSTFRSFPTSVADLAAGARGAAPGLSEGGRITEHVLQDLESDCRIIDVAKRLRKKFPRRFRTLADALARAGADARKFGGRPSV
jgi:PRMT5 arginine-N-methyltransferase/ribosomal protein L11 methyltransferase PrmA